MKTQQELIETLELWINARTHKERLLILLGSALVLFLIWYFLLEKPLSRRQTVIKTEIANLTPQIKLFDDESNHIQKESLSSSSEKKSDAEKIASIKLASSKDIDSLMTAILSPNQNIKVTALTDDSITAVTNKTTDKAATTLVPPPSASNTASKSKPDDSMSLEFQSDYFNTIAYLKQLEKLPWCLSWDSLEYLVVNYPNAAVTVNLHIVKAG